MLKLAGHTTSTQMKPPPAPAARSAEELDKEAEEKRNRQEMARKRREHLMKQMSAMQKNFIRENPEFFDATNEGGSPRHRTASTCSMETGDVPAHDYPCCLGPRHSPSVMAESSTATCILCQEEEDITFDGKAMVLAAFIQRSTVLSKARQKTIEDGEKFDPLFASSDLYWGTNVSTCGHIMHSTCWQGFFESLLAKEQRRNLRMRGILNYDISQHQFLCPLCETLSNTVIPLLPSVVGLQNATQEGAPVERKSGETAVNLQEWLEGIQKTLQASAQQKEFEKEQEEAGVVPMEAGANSAAASDEEDIEEKEEGEEEMTGEMELGAMGGEEGGAQGGGGLAEGGDGMGAKEMEDEGKVEGATAMPGAMEGGEIGVGSFIQISTIPSLKRLLAETVSQKFQQLFQFIQVSCLPISENVKEMIRHFSRSAYTVGLGVMPHDDDSRMAILAWNTCAYTVQVTETQLRNEGKALFGALSQRQMDCLRCLIRYSVVNSCLCNYAHVQRHAIRLLSALYPQESSGRPSDPCILDMDVFTLLVRIDLV
eukprot:XP_003729939.1 PREDICTED: E3 ubiquitin-protein ligase UBR2 [Strongylocentrotus purpuratus]